jgi:hypothetical protein
MKKMTEPLQQDWVLPILGFTFALTLAIGIGFLIGQETPPTPDDMSVICQHLPPRGATLDCIALRSAVATEEATSVARWALWVSFGSLVATAGALVGLIIAFAQGQRNIALATDANRIAMENSQTQARAYVVVQSVECQLNENGQLTARVKFQNSGLSPARGLRWLFNASLVAAYGDNQQRSLRLSDEPNLDSSHWRQDIPSAESWTSTPLALRQHPEVGDLINQAVFIAVTVKILADYQDVFGTTHREIACFQGRVNPAPADAAYHKLERAHDRVFDEQAERIAA